MSVKIPFRRELDFTYRTIETIAPGIRRIVAENPSPFTLHGTGTSLARDRWLLSIQGRLILRTLMPW